MLVFGRYKIMGEIGTGSMGTVYHVRDTVLDRDAALKTIRTGPEVLPELKERFYREARACARLQHPNIVTIFDLGEADGMAYIAMELLVGADLRTIIEQNRMIAYHAKIELIAQVCDGLDHAHRHGIVHRDIKTSNVFIHEENRAKLLDFGIARLPGSNLTLTGKVLGTPNYMAPEQITGGQCDSRSDLFSAAVVFFEFLSGVHPFVSSNIPRRIVRDVPESLCMVDPSMPLSVELIFAKGLEKNPDLRYQSGGDFAAALRSVLDVLPQPPRAPGGVQPPTPDDKGADAHSRNSDSLT